MVTKTHNFMTVKEVVATFGDDILEVREENKWVVFVYSNMTVRFKKW